jgi:hypothetical protein
MLAAVHTPSHCVVQPARSGRVVRVLARTSSSAHASAHAHRGTPRHEVHARPRWATGVLVAQELQGPPPGGARASATSGRWPRRCRASGRRGPGPSTRACRGLRRGPGWRGRSDQRPAATAIWPLWGSRRLRRSGFRFRRLRCCRPRRGTSCPASMVVRTWPRGARTAIPERGRRSVFGTWSTSSVARHGRASPGKRFLQRRRACRGSQRIREHVV